MPWFRRGTANSLIPVAKGEFDSRKGLRSSHRNRRRARRTALSPNPPVPASLESASFLRLFCPPLNGLMRTTETIIAHITDSITVGIALLRIECHRTIVFHVVQFRNTRASEVDESIPIRIQGTNCEL